MTDNEIIKAIEKCASIGESCEDCPFYEYTDCDKRLKECFHDMLNRQKAEIERLNILIKKADEHFSEGDFAKGISIIINLVKEMEGESK